MADRVLRLISNPALQGGPPLSRPLSPDEPQRAHFERLGLSVASSPPDRTELTGCFAGQVDIRAVARPPGDEEEPAPVVWDVLGHWRKRRRLCLHPSDLDEWLGLRPVDAFALLRGLRNDALAEALGPTAATDVFDWRGHRVLNPFRDRFGNETSPASEYGMDYRLWRARWREAL
ncbi:hypothetical protein QFZ27_006360 [Inquilinus ginsengisoli]|uniref:hypothetical protein n=1 Tax=Inquilinus ginsengisoli TaxID=363840 RepID=UPI003D246190